MAKYVPNKAEVKKVADQMFKSGTRRREANRVAKNIVAARFSRASRAAATSASRSSGT